MADIYMHLSVAAVTDLGRKRKNNEDAFGTHRESGVFCVADGMGGAEDGEVASHATVDSVNASLGRLARNGKPLSLQAMQAVLTRAINDASAWIFKRSEELGSRGTGTTFVGVCFDPERPGSALALHAGDSRLYRLRHRTITQITGDHSAAALAGVKDEKDLNPMFRGVVMRAVGVKADVELEGTAFDVAEGDQVLLCSDGLTRMVSDEEILELVWKSESVEKAAQALVDAANAHGGIDNVTVVLIHVGALPAPVAALSLADLATRDAGQSPVRAMPGSGAGETKTGDARSLRSEVVTPATPALSSSRVDRLFTSDSDERLESKPRVSQTAGPAETKAVPKPPPAVAQAPAQAWEAPPNKKEQKAPSHLVVKALAIFLITGAVLIAERTWMKGRKPAVSAEPIGVAAVQGTGGKPVPEGRQSPAVAAAEAATKAEAVIAAREKEAEERRLLELKAKEESDRAEAVRKEAEALATKEKEAGERRLAELKAKEESDRAEAARKEAEALAAKEKEAGERRLAELKAKEARDRAEAARKEAEILAANAKETERLRLVELKAKEARDKAEAEARVLAEKNRVIQSLVNLAGNGEMLARLRYAFSVSTDAGVKRDLNVLYDHAGRLAHCSGDLSAQNVKEAARDFVRALDKVAVQLPVLEKEWQNKIDQFEMLTSLSKEAGQARAAIAGWEKSVYCYKPGGDLDKDETRQGLVDLVGLTDAAMKALKAIPGFTDAKAY